MKKYWQDLEELNKQGNEEQNGNRQHEEGELSLLNMLEDNSSSSRRNFLKLFGFGIASASVLSSCEKPITKAIPYLIKPETITPGMASYFASTFYDGGQYGSILVKVRDGRPIKIEGNNLSPLSEGSTSALVQASVLELYDNNRIKAPLINKHETSWQRIDKEIILALNEIKSKNGNIVLLSSSIISPSTLKVINVFKKVYPTFKHIVYDPVSVSGMLQANYNTFGIKAVPFYYFDKAQIIVSFGADFLGNWLMPTEFAKAYIKNRKLDNGQKNMSRHIQFETGLSLTGSNADERIPLKPSEEKLAIAGLYSELLELSGKAPLSTLPETGLDLTSIAKELISNKEKSIVVSSSNNPETQEITNAINILLNNYSHTIDIDHPVFTKSGDDTDLYAFLNELKDGKIDGLLIYNANPVYELPNSEAIKAGLKQTALSVSFANTWDETSSECLYICPDNHYLESWNDANPVSGQYSLAQPTVLQLFNTRQFQDSMLKWGKNNTSYPDFIKQYWKENLFESSSNYANFNDFWNNTLQKGVLTISDKQKTQSKTHNTDNITNITRNLKPVDKNTVEVHLYENNTIGTGKHTNNPWLQETPDPISKVCWDNYAAISPKFAEENSIKTGDIILVNDIEIPALVQPGQAYNTISIALGYGRKVAGIAGKDIGINAFPLIKNKNNHRSYSGTVEFGKTDKTHTLAVVQTHSSMEGRAIIREASLEEYLEHPAAGNELHKKVQHHQESLYKEHKFEGHHWGMSIDLNSCIGCNACVVACTAENNVPVVGKKEVNRVHEMHWIRIDRYYSGDPENPEVLRQPVMCQHCDNAPCENVCPVAATTHSSEGINQMAYNRCIGTRYCNNNCPYKVRRFNWFDYTKADALPANTIDPAGMTLDLPRMVLNPDVTIRAKGVMEKCSFCVQRIQEKKLNAKIENRTLKDGEVQTACQQACATKAITFGDMSDKNSRIAKLIKDERNYHLLEELHTLPSVGYLTKIRNRRKL